jgi:hypothetical protein
MVNSNKNMVYTTKYNILSVSAANKDGYFENPCFDRKRRFFRRKV